MTRQHPESPAIAGLCFLACGLIVALAYVSTLIRTYAPIVREFLLWAATPQLGIGLVLGMAVMAVTLLAFAWSEP